MASSPIPAILFFFASLLCAAHSSPPPNQDTAALLQFLSAISDPTDALRSWTSDTNPCYWTGISCNEADGSNADAPSGRVVAVQLQGLSLSATFSSAIAALQNLPFLQVLSLANNNLTGPISASLLRLPASLQKLDLSQNSLNGAISAIAPSSSLASLDLSHNLISGILPSNLFSDNSCKDLRFLSVAANNLEGPIPASIAACTDLRTLNLSSNRFSGTITAVSLPQLKFLDLSENHLSGDLPTLPPSLLEARLQRNAFTGTMASMNLAGCAANLEHLDVSNNRITGPFPEEMEGSVALTELDVSHNAISRSIPQWLGSSLTSLRRLNLAYNELTEQVPATMGLLKGLLLLDLSNNRLTGSIPATVSGCDALRILDLSFNSLQGELPDVLPPDLVSVSFAGNDLSGTVPNALYRRCQSLQRLDLSQNRLSGPTPSITSCPSLQYFNASGNSFGGQLPEDLFASGNVSVFDMSRNLLSGHVPACSSSVESTPLLSVLLLDHNRLDGSIPRQLGNCSSLICLNLSQNKLSGSIPLDLGALQSLQKLDLSHNNLSGKMPSELGSLQNLDALNLSYNELEGPVPGYGVLLKFNSTSFLGNARLCGANVNVTCPTAVPKPLVLDPATIGALPDIQSILPRTASSPQHRRAMLSVSAIVAIAAATAIAAGVMVILFLNAHAAERRRAALPPLPQSSTGISSSAFASSLKSSGGAAGTGGAAGKLVMFAKVTDPRSEQWITSAHALLNKDAELGRGGESGAIYKAVLADGRTVVIKKLSLAMALPQFDKEMQILGRIKHKNLLSLQGYYYTPPLQLLIYDFIPNGNLYRKLHEQGAPDGAEVGGAAAMDWPARFRIAVGVAKGLAHLHYACDPPIIHYLIKSSNILLDDRCNPKISDCGLAGLLPVPDRYMSAIAKSQRTSLGYMAPELAVLNSRVDSKCDVYGYGVLLLELVTGRRPMEYVGDDAVMLCDFVRTAVEKGKAMACVDPKLKDYTEEEVLPVIKLGLICSMHVASGRPSMAEVVQILERVKASGGSSSAGSREVL